MKPLRHLAVAAIVAATAWISWACVWRPLQCHRLRGDLSQASYDAFDRRHDQSARRLAAENLARLEKCLVPTCRNVHLFFLLAINQRTLGRPEVALGLYEEALRYDKRPEIYANIADTQLSMGNTAEAYRNFTTAVSFFPGYLRMIDDPAMRLRIRTELLERHPEQLHMVERIESPEADRFMRAR